MQTLSFFIIGNRKTESDLLNEVIEFFKTIPNFNDLIETNDILFVEADKNEELKYAFGTTSFAGNEDSGDGHTSCDMWNVVVTENNSETLKDYINAVGYEEGMDGLGSGDGYSIEGETITEHTIDLNF